MANRLTVGSLFSGIGGFDLGFERAGFDIAWQVEFDPFCQSVLKKHWPNAKLYSDIREVNANELQPVDVVCGGFPCQPVSVSGKRKGQQDERWLWPEFARIIRGIRPRYVVVENVPGLLTVDGGRLFGVVLGDLAACGYDAEWQVLSAAALGAWHRRERLFIVAYPSCQRLEEREVFGGDAGQKLTAFARDCSTGTGIWAVESGVCPTLDGISNRVERLKALGNAVVPQVAEYLARLVLAHAQK